MCERRKRIERRRCCRFHRFLQHLRQSVSQKPSCRAGRRALAECYTFFRFGAGFDDRRVVVWNPTPWRVICCAVRKCGRRSVAARAEVRAKLWGTREAGIRTGRPTGTIFPERLAVRSRLQKTGRLHLAAAAFPNAFPVGRRACPAQIRRMKPAPCVCGFIQSRMAAASSVCFSAEKSLPRQAAARGKDAARFLPTFLRRSARRPSRNAEPWRKRRFRCGLLDAAYGSRRVYPSCGSVGCFCCAAAFSVLHYERSSVSGAWLCCAPSYV